MTPTQDDQLFAWQWHQRLVAREVSATELAQHFLERLERTNPAINAVAWLDEDRVLAQAGEADTALASGSSGPLTGLPITVKDNLAVAGLPCASGTWGRRSYVPDHDAASVARARAAGAVVLAKSSMPELAASYETDNALVGRTNHPFDPERTPGGSSGGEGALIGAGASVWGIGTDGGGSIRVPSHYCGIFGLRPTVGRIPETGAWPSTRSTGYADLTCVGPMARCTRDVAWLLSVLSGPDHVDPYAHPVPLRSYEDVDIAGLRVGFYTEIGTVPVSPETREAVRRAAQGLEAAGAHVEEVVPPDLSAATSIFFRATGAMGGHDLVEQIAGAEGHHTAQFRRFLDLMQLSEPTASDYFTDLAELHRFRSRIRRWLQAYDVVLCPVVTGPAPLHGTPPFGVDQQDYFSYEAFNSTHTYSVAGVPALSVPVGRPGEGLPIGVQIVAPPWREDLVLAASAALELHGVAAAW